MTISDIYSKLNFLNDNYRIYCANFIGRNYQKIATKIEIDQVLTLLKNNEPIEYILNLAEFCNYKFYVDKNCLIPRHETENLATHALEVVIKHDKDLPIFDIGTGSGCIIISLIMKLIDAKVDLNRIKFYAIDISKEALEIAVRNSKYHKVFELINFINEDFRHFDFSSKLSSKNLVLANLPYIPNSRVLEKSVIDFEPHQALFGGVKGDELNNLLIDFVIKLKQKHDTTLIYEGDDGVINTI